MAAFQLVISHGVPGDPADVGNTDNVAVQIGFKNTSAASWAASIGARIFIGALNAVASGLDLGGLLQVLGMGLHLGQNSADPVVLHTHFWS
jgi:hypothetical protein